MLVMKFGGTSVGSAQNIRRVVDIVKSKQDRKPLVVVSAFSKVTDALLVAAARAAEGSVDVAPIRERHAQMLQELGLPANLLEEQLGELATVLDGIALAKSTDARSFDAVSSFGEQMSTKVIEAYARSQNVPFTRYLAYDIGMLTDSNFGRAEILPESYLRLERAISGMPPDEIPLVTGFIAKDAHGALTTLGRGGSDYTAAIIGAAIGADAIEIWTDVDGIMTADPRVVPSARTLERVSFAEASELAYFGAKVLHPKTIRPAMQKGIPVIVLNTLNPAGRGTTILGDDKPQNEMTSIVCKRDVAVINLYSPEMVNAYGFLHKIFKVFGDEKVSVDQIATSEVNIAVTVAGASVTPQLLDKLRSIADVSVEADRATIGLVGRDIKTRAGLGAKVFAAIAAAGINIELTSQGASLINMSFVVAGKDADRAVQVIHETFFEGETQ